MDIHPGPNAGDGRLRPRDTTYKPGDNVQELLICAQCGFPFRPGKDLEGDSEDSPGIVQISTKVAVTQTPSKLPVHLQPPYVFQDAKSYLLDENGNRILLEDGSGYVLAEDNVMSLSVPSVQSGCRFCGTLNPRAIGRNKDFDYGFRDLSNR